MELISLFDSDTLAGQRVRLFETSNGRPSDIVKDLESIFKAVSMSDKTSSVKFMPIDRINTIIAVAPNPGVFAEVEKWVKKLDMPVKVTAGSVDNYVYRLKYGRAETVGMAVMALYGGYGGFGFPGGGYPGGGYPGGGYPGGGYPGGGYPGGGYPGGAYPGGAYPGGMSPYGMGVLTTSPAGLGMQGTGGAPLTGAAPGTMGPAGATTTAGTGDLTGSFLGFPQMMGAPGKTPRIIPNPFDNTLLVQATPQEWEQISKLLEQLDIPPRQVLIDAKIYEVTLNKAFSSAVSAVLQTGTTPGARRNASSLARTLLVDRNDILGLKLSSAMLVGQSRQLLAVVTAQESAGNAKTISEPSIIATDSIPATINAGTEVPILTSQAVAGVQSGGTSLFTNTVSSRNTGISLNIVARVNSSGVVTLVINQEVSAPQAPAAGGINSPSFQKRNVSTQVTVEDGDTIAIGGVIQESDSYNTSGIPVLHRIPGLGALFGSKSISKARTELIVFLRPRVIYDTAQVAEASEELKSKLKRLRKLIKE
jgi:general secretion pathway protein D